MRCAFPWQALFQRDAGTAAESLMLVKKRRTQSTIGRTPATVDLRAPDVTRSDEMYVLVYQDLKRIARHHLHRMDAGTLCTTELLHEAFLKLGGATTFEGRAHFFGAASRAMRQVLVDFARRRNAKKRRTGADDITLSDGHGALEVRLDELIALDGALEQLNLVDPQLRELVELRFFGGLPVNQVASLLGVTTRTVERNWMKARLFLLHELQS
jgi:RNA polymerase sigma factor (TIGR02999 family)